jgi:hypothetical protein
MDALVLGKRAAKGPNSCARRLEIAWTAWTATARERATSKKRIATTSPLEKARRGWWRDDTHAEGFAFSESRSRRPT